MIVRAMRPEDCEAVVAMVHGLASDTRAGLVPALDAETLRIHACGPNSLIDVVVAEAGGDLAGACLGLMTFSTWRGAKGLYVVDLFVAEAYRGRGLGPMLLRESARRAAAKGARFVKLEVDHTNDGASRFYERLGFARKESDRLFILDPPAFSEFLGAEWLGD